MNNKYRNRASLQTQKRAIELYRNGMSFSQIGKELGFTASAISLWFKKHGVEIKPKSIIVHCSYCGKAKTIFPSVVRIKKMKHHFCNMDCKGKWWSESGSFTGKNNPRYKPKVKTKCANCGESLNVNPSRIPETGNVYCNSHCQFKGMSKHFSGDLSHNWRGGLAAEPYCPVWLDREFKADIRQRDGDQCQNPDCRGNSDKLCLHHINYDKKDCHPNNLITLCYSCNGRANFDREWHAGYYKAVMQKNNHTFNQGAF